MDTFILLSAATLISLVIHLVFRGISVSSHENVANESTSTGRGESESLKDVNPRDKPVARIFVPNLLLTRWPWSRRINPHYATIEREVAAWVADFQAFSPEVGDIYNRCKTGLLGGLAYPDASKEHLRAACSFMPLTFILDDYCEKSSPLEVRKQKDAVLDAFRNPDAPRSEGEWFGIEMARQFWELTRQSATKISQKRFIQSMDEYYESIVQEVVNRKSYHILDTKSYIEKRRLTGGVQPSFCIIELGLDIPDEAMLHPAIREMTRAAADMITLCNDVYSYNVEQMRGDDLLNIITCVMNEYHTDVNGAILWVEDYLHGAGERFLTAMESLPQWEEPLNSQMKVYCCGMGQWVRANYDWSFESERYFGNQSLEIKEKKWMSLLPKKLGLEVGPMHACGPLCNDDA